MATRTERGRESESCTLPEHSTATSERATAAGLIFTSDCLPGIRRLRQEDGSFAYAHDDGRRVTKADLRRLERLTIPPAWEDVWICADERGHLQATGRDSRGRKQYRYHESWRALRDETKYERMVAFGDALPKLRARVDSDLRRPALDRRRVLALVVAVLDKSLIRVGNPQYARANDSFGLTTLHTHHVDAGATTVAMRFRGKAGKQIEARIDDPRIARAIHRLRDLPGHELFQYVDDDGVHLIGSADVNDYLRETTGESITSKDFRTWGGTLAAAVSLMTAEGAPHESAIAAAIREAADVLRNTPAVCRRSYVNPELLDLYRSGKLAEAWRDAKRAEPKNSHLSDDERALLGALRRLSSRG